MFNLSITACSFFLQKSNSKAGENIFDLNHPISYPTENGEENVISVPELFEHFFRQYQAMKKDDDKQRSFHCDVSSIKELDTPDFKATYVRILSGIYGSSSEILDGESQEIKYTKTASDIETRPFFVFVVIPKDNDRVTVQKGMLIFQNVGPFGIKTLTTEYMRSFFSEYYSIAIKCRTIAPELFVNKVIRSDNIKKVHLIRNMKSADGADDFSLGYGSEVRELRGIHFDTPLGTRIMDGIRWFVGGKHRLFEFENQEYSSVKLTVDIGGRDSKIDLHNIDNLSIIESVPDDIRMADGHPNEELLVKHLRSVIQEYLSEMVLRIS